MSQQLWLFRHGIAEKKDTSKDDTKRELTKKGFQEVQRSAPNLRYLLNLENPVFIWSSPLTRALQTAEVLAETLGDISIDEKEFIAAGDFQQLTQELKELPEDCTVIAVGHEPSLSDWSKNFTGTALPFGKGSCAAFSMEQTPRLLWFLQSDALQTLGTSDNTDSLKLKLLLQQHITEAQSLHAAFLNDPLDPETTHQLRVELRHLRSMLSFLKPLLAENIYEEAKVPLKDAFHQFSYLRELDVLIEETKKVNEAEPDLISDVEKLIAKISEAREKEKSRLIHSSNQSKIRNILTDLWDWTESVDWYPLVVEEESFAQFADKKINQKHKKLKKRLKKLDTNDPDKVHQSRIESKKYRYILTDFSPLLEDNHKKRVKRTKKIQNKLSIVPDLQHNMLALEGFIKEETNKVLKKDLNTLYAYENKRLETQLAALKDKTLKLN